MDEILGAVQRTALQGGVLLLVGAAIWKLWIARSAFRTPALAAGGQTESVLTQRVASIAAAIALALIPIWLLRFALQLIAFRDPFVPLSEDVLFLLQETIFGPVWIAQGITIIVLAIVFGRLRGAPVGTLGSNAGSGMGMTWGVGIAGAAALALTLAMSSHALSVEGNRELAVAADLLHTLAAGAWIGSLVLVLSTRKLPIAGADTYFAAQLRAFSPLATVCVTLLVAMGVFLGWQYLGSVSDLWSTAYGRILAAKVAVAGIVMLMGFVNWRRGMPAIDSAEARSAVSKRASWEVLIAVVVLVLTGILTGTPR